MNISLVLLHEDKQYKSSFLHFFGEFYPQTGVYAFSDPQIMAEAVSRKPADVLLVSEEIYNASPDTLTSGSIRCKVIIVLTKGRGINRIDNYDALCQYQPVDDLYREFVNIYADKMNVLPEAKSVSTRVYTFMSGAGGCGCSTAAASYAMYLASQGSKVIYVDMSSLGVPEIMFDGESSYTMTDCFTAVLSGKNNLNIQLETYTGRDSSGVYFYFSCGNALDWEDISFENKAEFLNCLISGGSYDNVVCDLPCEWSETTALMYERSDKFFIVSDGRASSNIKNGKLFDMIFTYIRSKELDPSGLRLVYSNFREGSVKMQDDRVDEYTVLPEIKKSSNLRELVGRLSVSELWER